MKLNLVRNAGFLYSFLIVSGILYLVFHGLVNEYFVHIAGLLVFNLILFLGLPKFVKNKLLLEFKDGFEDFGIVLSKIIVGIFLWITYVFAVGIVSLLAKLAGKKFMNLKLENKRSYWIDRKTKPNDIFGEMY